jgi:hypothetical protein
MPEGRLHVYLADTLESPFRTASALALSERRLVEEHEAARQIKTSGNILVIMGNPPYDRQAIEHGDGETRRKGGWVRFGDQDAQEEDQRRPILQDFLEPARAAGQGVHLKNVYNDYVYFWRWALWRAFEQQSGGGVVSFITASSYLAGPGFIGMREAMRREFDELWILDLGGDNLGTRKTPNVFAIQTPVAIAIGLRASQPQRETAARVHYARIDAATSGEKLAALDAISNMASVNWQDCPTGWREPFLPAGQGNYFGWPCLTDIFPWQHSGAQFKRTWPIAVTVEVLERRWRALVSVEDETVKAALFRLTRDRSLRSTSTDGVPGVGQPSLVELDANAPAPAALRYSYRSFDRRYALYDGRLGDYLRPELFSTMSNSQIFLCGLLTKTSALGPTIVATSYMPDMDFFCGRGAKDIIPLYRDSACQVPNLTTGLLDTLSGELGYSVNAEDLAAYVAAILGSRSFAERMWNELSTPGPRVPITKTPQLFREIADLGRQLICYQTFRERMRPTNQPHAGVPPGHARCASAIPDTPEGYPNDHEFSIADETLKIGSGRIEFVSPEVMSFEVSGLNVVGSWLDYRMREPRGRVTSELNQLLPAVWSHTMTDELLELIWTLESIVELEPRLGNALDRVLASECFLYEELPIPTDDQRRPPRLNNGFDDNFLTLME